VAVSTLRVSFEKHAAMRFFRKVLRVKDEAAIYSIETESYLAQPLTNDIVRLEQTIVGFAKPEGGTSLFDAIVDASRYLHPYSGRRVIVIVSDGIETTSRFTEFDAVVQHVLADDCQIYVVQTGLVRRCKPARACSRTPHGTAFGTNRRRCLFTENSFRFGSSFRSNRRGSLSAICPQLFTRYPNIVMACARHRFENQGAK